MEEPGTGTTGDAGVPSLAHTEAQQMKVREQPVCARSTASRAQREWERFSRTVLAGTHELASSLAGAVPENQQQAPTTPFLMFSEKPGLCCVPFQPVTRSLLINKAVSGQSSLVIRSLSETQSCRHHPPDPPLMVQLT